LTQSSQQSGLATPPLYALLLALPNRLAALHHLSNFFMFFLIVQIQNIVYINFTHLNASLTVALGGVG